MKPGGGKQKGGNFEREVCKKLSLWVSEGKSDDLFGRSAMSGGRATVRSKKGKETASGQGDITAVVPEGNSLTNKFVIECKNYKSLDFDNYIYGQGSLLGFWFKLLKDSEKVNKFPMLIMKENRKPVLVGLDFKVSEIMALCVIWSGMYIYYLDSLMQVPLDKMVADSPAYKMGKG
jgi:hypothetical protein